MIIDTHAHYDDKQYDKDRDELIKEFQDNNIEYVVNIGASIETSQNTIDFTKKYDFFYGAIGVHPSETQELDEHKIEWLKQQAITNKKIVAIGEIGLDYYWSEPGKELQRKWFEEQLELARTVKLPVVIHSREAAKDTIDILKAHKARELGGVIHCYSYSKEMVKDYADMGFFFGIGGVVTFKNSKKLKEAVELMPLDRIVLETDAPYLSPEPNRGKRNSSLNIEYIARQLCLIKGLEYDELLEVTNANAKKLYRI